MYRNCIFILYEAIIIVIQTLIRTLKKIPMLPMYIF